MGASTKIEWSDASWTPIRARVKPGAAAIAEAKGYTSLIHIAAEMEGRVGPHCEKISHGCDRCCSCSYNARGLSYNGTRLPFDRRSRDLVDPFVDEYILAEPLSARVQPAVSSTAASGRTFPVDSPRSIPHEKPDLWVSQIATKRERKVMEVNHATGCQCALCIAKVHETAEEHDKRTLGCL